VRGTEGRCAYLETNDNRKSPASCRLPSQKHCQSRSAFQGRLVLDVVFLAVGCLYHASPPIAAAARSTGHTMPVSAKATSLQDG
jgi:hypothetical protein